MEDYENDDPICGYFLPHIIAAGRIIRWYHTCKLLELASHIGAQDDIPLLTDEAVSSISILTRWRVICVPINFTDERARASSYHYYHEIHGENIQIIDPKKTIKQGRQCDRAVPFTARMI